MGAIKEMLDKEGLNILMVGTRTGRVEESIKLVKEMIDREKI